jgi:hypothetical protein
MQTMLKGSTTPFGLIASKRVIDKGPPRTLEVSENGGLASCRGIADCEFRIADLYSVRRLSIRNSQSKIRNALCLCGEIPVAYALPIGSYPGLFGGGAGESDR